MPAMPSRSAPSPPWAASPTMRGRTTSRTSRAAHRRRCPGRVHSTAQADTPGQEELGKTLVRAMIAAAKADGRSMPTRRKPSSKARDHDALVRGKGLGVRRTLDARSTSTPSSPAPIRPSTPPKSMPPRWSPSPPIRPSERAYLDALAYKLKLAPGLVAEIHKAAGEHTRADPCPRTRRLRPSAATSATQRLRLHRLCVLVAPADRGHLWRATRSASMEIGLYSFAENTPDPLNGNTCNRPPSGCSDLLEEIELADQLGLDFYGLGEHHRPDFVASAPVTILAAAAARTKTIRLSTAVTVLSSDDPIRVWQQFSTLDLLSNGRAEIMAGRGSFIESFPLFGYDLDDYDDAVRGKARRMLLAIREGRQGHLAGLDPHQADPRHRDLSQAGAGPAAAVDRRRRHAQLGGPRRLFRPAADDRHHRRPAAAVPAAGRSSTATPRRRSATTSTSLPVGISSHGFIAETAQDAMRHRLPGASGRHEPHRQGARLAADDARSSSRPAPARTAPISWARRSRSSTRS